MTTYYSHATWSKIGESTDKHNNSDNAAVNKKFAFAIAAALKDRWGHSKPPCELRGTCLKSWVTDEKGSKITE